MFSDLREEISETRRLASEAKRGADQSTTASCGGGRRGGGASDED
jgi:hypothetical protein